MKDPARLLTTTDRARAAERRILEVERSLQPPPHAERAVWQALAQTLPLSSAGVAAATHGVGKVSLPVSSAASGGKMIATVALKAVAGGALLGVITGVGWFGLAASRQPPSASVSAPRESSTVPAVVRTSPVTAMRAVSAAAQPPNAVVPAAARAATPTTKRAEPVSEPAPSVSSSPPPNEYGVAFESRQVARARSLLQSGHARDALSELARLEREGTTHVLTQERDALNVQALAAGGDTARAQVEGRRFLARFPESPYAELVQRALQ